MPPIATRTAALLSPGCQQSGDHQCRFQSNEAGDYSVPLELINPDDLPIPQMYTQVVVATGSRLVFVSGQQPEDIHGKLVGHGDFAAQARLAFGNLGRALSAAGARPEQVCKITIYIVDYRRDEHVPIIEEAQASLFGDHKPANVVVGVAIMSPGYLIEVDAIAVIDEAVRS
jgi:enamine deaminase RidA (YjgF/YER057c/UK114 family)